MTTPTNNKPAFPLRSAAVAISLAAFGAWLFVALVLPMLLDNVAGTQPAIAVGVLAAWCGALAGLLPIAMLATTGMIGAVMGYLYGTALRLMVGLVIFGAAALALDLPTNTLAGSMIASYLILLVVDAAFVHRSLSKVSPQPAALPQVSSTSNSNAQTSPPQPPEVMV